MATRKFQRNAEDVHRELTDILRGLKDPRVKDAMLSVVRVDLSTDLSSCKVYVSSLKGMEATKEAVKGLKNAAGFIRHEMGQRLTQLRRSPAFEFIADNSIEHGAEIARKLNELKYNQPQQEEAQDEEE